MLFIKVQQVFKSPFLCVPQYQVNFPLGVSDLQLRLV